FINLAQSARRIGERTVLAGWLLIATRYVAMDARKRQRRRQSHERAAASIAPGVQESAPPDPWHDVAPVLDGAIAKLSPANRDVLVLRYFAGHSTDEVARTLQISPDAVKQRLARAVRHLRRLLTARGGVTISAAALAGLVSANAVHACPPDLLGRAVAGAATTSPLT